MVRTQLFEPLHMTGASIGMADLTCARIWARPYRNGYPVKLTDAYYRVPAAAGVNSNILDMARWMEAQMGKEPERSEEHTSELQSLMRITYAVLCLTKKQELYNTHPLT